MTMPTPAQGTYDAHQVLSQIAQLNATATQALAQLNGLAVQIEAALGAAYAERDQLLRQLAATIPAPPPEPSPAETVPAVENPPAEDASGNGAGPDVVQIEPVVASG